MTKSRKITKARAPKPTVAGRTKGTEPHPSSLNPRANTKQAKLISLLRRPGGATIDDLAKATGWQHHTIRGAISGALKKRLGITVMSEKPDDGHRVYRIV